MKTYQACFIPQGHKFRLSRLATQLSFIVPAILLLLSAHNLNAEQSPSKTPLIKLDATGHELAQNATTWAMVKDPGTGLIWEIKTTDGSIHGKNNLYKWKKAEKEFISNLNKMKFGGYDDWRMPMDDELETLQTKQEGEPRIDLEFFPHTAAAPYLAYSLCGDGSYNSSRVNFALKKGEKSRIFRVRAVRGKKN